MESLVRVSSAWQGGGEMDKERNRGEGFFPPTLNTLFIGFFFFKAGKYQKPQSRKTDLGTN